jgi:hypothetical protein
MPDLDDLRDLDWLVAARNEIQSLMLDLYKQRAIALSATDRTQSRRWQLGIGAAFSLWRAVLLVNPEDVDRRVIVTAEESAAFLHKIITTNPVAFGDENNRRELTGWYYMNNARFRLSELLGQPLDPFTEYDILRVKLNQYFRLLRQEARDRFYPHAGNSQSEAPDR